MTRILNLLFRRPINAAELTKEQRKSFLIALECLMKWKEGK